MNQLSVDEDDLKRQRQLELFLGIDPFSWTV